MVCKVNQKSVRYTTFHRICVKVRNHNANEQPSLNRVLFLTKYVHLSACVVFVFIYYYYPLLFCRKPIEQKNVF